MRRFWEVKQSEKSTDTVFKVHDEVAFVELTEINLCAIALRAAQTPARMGRESPKKCRGRKDDEIGCGKTKSARKCAFDKIDPFNGAGHDLAKALDLALS